MKTKQKSEHLEAQGTEGKTEDRREMKIDKKTGLILSPQPTDDVNDPLNWPPWLKWVILIQIAFAAFQTPFNNAMLIGGFEQMANAYDVPVSQIVYLVSIYVLPNAWGPLIMVPMSSIYGRRPIYIASFVLVTITSAVSGFAPTWSAQAALRAFNGFGLGSAVSIGASTITDVFFQHERGKAVGVWTLLTNTGAFWGTFLGGYIVALQDWTWNFKACAIIDGTILLGMIFLLPETLYPRNTIIARENTKFDYWDRFVVVRRRHDGKLTLLTILRPLRMCLYPSVFFPAFCVGLVNTFTAVGMSLIFPTVYENIFGFSLKAASNVNFALIIGALLGELFAGAWSDWVLTIMAKRHGNERIPELRLKAIYPGLIITPVKKYLLLRHFVFADLQQGRFDYIWCLFNVQYAMDSACNRLCCRHIWIPDSPYCGDYIFYRLLQVAVSICRNFLQLRAADARLYNSFLRHALWRQGRVCMAIQYLRDHLRCVFRFIYCTRVLWGEDQT